MSTADSAGFSGVASNLSFGGSSIVTGSQSLSAAANSTGEGRAGSLTAAAFVDGVARRLLERMLPQHRPDVVLLDLLYLFDRFPHVLVEVAERPILRALPASVLQEEVVDIPHVALVPFRHRAARVLQVALVGRRFAQHLLNLRGRVNDLRLPRVRVVHLLTGVCSHIRHGCACVRYYRSVRLLPVSVTILPLLGAFSQLFRLPNRVVVMLHDGHFLGRRGVRFATIRSPSPDQTVVRARGLLTFEHFQQLLVQTADAPLLRNAASRRSHFLHSLHIRVPLSQHQFVALLRRKTTPGLEFLLHQLHQRIAADTVTPCLIQRGIFLQQVPVQRDVLVEVLEDVKETLARHDWRPFGIEHRVVRIQGSVCSKVLVPGGYNRDSSVVFPRDWTPPVALGGLSSPLDS
uniref:Uncharacterized protein n=1 Tax=Anopheles atroparvus TaxID=41427 RepID=A0A182ISH1_ANOAO